MTPFWIKTAFKAWVLPPTGPLLIVLSGIVWGAFAPKRGRILALCGLFLLAALSMPGVAILLIRALDLSGPLEPGKLQGAQAIVILGGGTRPDAIEYGGDTLGRLTLERVRYGARVAKMTGLPVLVTGGRVDGHLSEATLMRSALESEFAVPVRWIEPRSRNTHENAVFSSAILRAAGIGRVVLVAHAFDMPRARLEFADAGIEIIPAPIGIPSAADVEVADFMPSIGGMQNCYYALYEIFGNLWYRVERSRG